jgi:methyl-accepting chemotaxis protein
MVTEIATASQEQSQGVQEITKAVAQLDQVTQQNTTDSTQSSHEAEKLSLQAKMLNRLVQDLVKAVEGEPKEQVSEDEDEELERVLHFPLKEHEESIVPLKKIVSQTTVPSGTDKRFEDI